MTLTHDAVEIEWLGYATVRIEGPDQIIYLDPGRYGVLSGEWDPDSQDAAEAHPSGVDFRAQDGDLVCVTHRHHYDPAGIERVASENATIAAFEGINPRNSSRDLSRFADLPYDLKRVGSEADKIIAETPVWTVAAYNDPEGPRTRANGEPFHPEGRGCGFLLTVGGTRIFWPGDTDVLAGHAQLDVDVLLPPIGGAFTMDRTEAAALAVEMDPELVVPIHYNTFDALETDSQAFAADVAQAGIPVALDEGS